MVLRRLAVGVLAGAALFAAGACGGGSAATPVTAASAQASSVPAASAASASLPQVGDACTLLTNTDFVTLDGAAPSEAVKPQVETPGGFLTCQWGDSSGHQWVTIELAQSNGAAVYGGLTAGPDGTPFIPAQVAGADEAKQNTNASGGGIEMVALKGSASVNLTVNPINGTVPPLDKVQALMAAILAQL